MIILGIETSCDETAAAIVKNGVIVKTNAVASSLPSHSKTGGIIPEVASREQINSLVPVFDSVFGSNRNLNNVDAIAVTFGPGLIGCLFVGVEAAKTLSYSLNKPLVPVNHLIGHLYSAWIENKKPPKFPLIALIVSGGHTELLYVLGHGNYKHLGGTRDDAAGEAFDKISRLLGLGYPGGPAIEKAASKGTSGKYQLPRPMKGDGSYDFSFSGLKTAADTLINNLKHADDLYPNIKSNLAAEIQEAIVDVLVDKTIKAAKNYSVKTIVLGGGVAANKYLRKRLSSSFDGVVQFSAPKFAVDNGAMIASAAFFNYKPTAWRKVQTDASVLF